MKFWHPFWLVATIALKQVVAEGPSWTIYHSWNGGKDYARRGVLEWKSDDDGLVVTNDEAALTPAQLDEMLAFGLYQVKIDTGDSDYILSTVPACSLRRANFRDEFSVTLLRAGSEQQITSLAYTPLVSPLAPETCEELQTPETITLHSKVEAALETTGLAIPAVLPNQIAAISASGLMAGALMVTAPYVFVSAVHAIGFGAGGISAGTFAATMMSTGAIAGGGGVVAGGIVATLQSIGVAGLGATGTAAAMGCGAVAASAVVGTTTALVKSNDEEVSKEIVEE